MNDSDVTPFPGVYLREGSTVYQFGIQVPTDLREHFKTQWAVRKSLGTKDLREANAQAKALHADWEEKFGTLRRRQNPEPVTLTPALVATFAREVRRWVLEADDNMRAFPSAARALQVAQLGTLRAELEKTPAGAALVQAVRPNLSALTIGGQDHPSPAPDPLAGLSAPEAEALAQWNAAGVAAAAVDMARQNLRSVLPLAEGIAREMGLRVNWTSPEGVQGLRELLKAHRQATEEALLRDRGEVVNTPAAEPSTSASSGHPQEGAQQPAGGPNGAKAGHTPMDAFEAWQRRKPGRPVKSVAKYRATAEKLAKLARVPILEQLTREDGRAIQDKLMAEATERGGRAQNTAASELGRIKTLFNEAVDLGWIDRSPMPARGIERIKADRRAWTKADLPRLFDDPIFTAYAVPSASMGGLDAAYWLPLLGLFTGARVSELAQLRTSDIEHTEEAGWVLHIQEDQEEGLRVKNAHSVRDVPIHPELVRLGFVDYWRAIAEHGAGPLWPALPRTELNGAGGKISQWFGKYKAAKGFGPDLVFHSFRHTVETELRALRTPKYLIDAITGHAGKTVADDYAHTTVGTLREALDPLAYPGLELPRVFTAPAWKP